MIGSALLGREPLSADDTLIVRGIQLTIPSLLKAAPLLSEQGNHDSRATSMTIGDTLAIALALSITIARLAARWSKLHKLEFEKTYYVSVIPRIMSSARPAVGRLRSFQIK
ncbi:MAG: hypothetical protein OHK93_006874 [Ramalina farinacea]|uniref:Uncharacterized protein n=1 Tax=Ramalina farinacea TaxID=258253 RepID=A0AA43TTX0_9LECA|nr:hypothetical protein [Ramalina farinacea]